MEPKKFEAILIFLVPKVVQLIMENEDRSEVEASGAFYTSRVYALLEQENTKLWHLSPLTLYNMYEEERETGTFTFPEEAQ